MNPLAVAALLAVDPAGLGGVALRSAATPARDDWLKTLRQLLPATLPLRRIPLHADDSRLSGGLDLAASLRTGRPVVQMGLLAQTDGGVALLASAERVGVASAARLAQVMDTGVVLLERNGLSARHAARLGVVALDEGASDDEHLPAALLDRLAFHMVLDPQAAPTTEPGGPAIGPEAVAQARGILPQVTASDEQLQALCGAAAALGVASLRGPLLALRAARVSAALDGRMAVDTDDCNLATQLVLAPRATRLPDMQPQEEEEAEDAANTPGDPPQPAAASPEQGPPQDEPPASNEPTGEQLEDMLVQAALAAIPPGLLAALQFGQTQRARGAGSRGSGAQQQGKPRGRPVGTRRGEPGAGKRLHVLETLRAAAPWQKLRQREAELAGAAATCAGTAVPAAPRVHVRREDFHVGRFKQRRETTTIFVVDASGSAALHRLAEAKGAVELLLADCYVRRDRVAVLAFRGKLAELLLPPTRSLVRAKRSLAGLPGGGGTPLAAAVDAAHALAMACSRRGETPIVVLLTDGRANIARDGAAGRERATLDAMAAARALRADAVTALLLDTSPHAQPGAQQLALAMGAAYLPLPHAGAAQMSQAVRLASGTAASAR